MVDVQMVPDDDAAIDDVWLDAEGHTEGDATTVAMNPEQQARARPSWHH